MPADAWAHARAPVAAAAARRRRGRARGRRLLFLPDPARAPPAALRARPRGDAGGTRPAGGVGTERGAHLLRPRPRILADHTASTGVRCITPASHRVTGDESGFSIGYSSFPRKAGIQGLRHFSNCPGPPRPLGGRYLLITTVPFQVEHSGDFQCNWPSTTLRTLARLCPT